MFSNPLWLVGLLCLAIGAFMDLVNLGTGYYRFAQGSRQSGFPVLPLIFYAAGAYILWPAGRGFWIAIAVVTLIHGFCGFYFQSLAAKREANEGSRK